MNFGEKLTNYRKKAGLSQEALGEKLNVTRQTVSKWELGQTAPGMDDLSRMSELFNVTVDELIKEGEKQVMENMDNKEVKVENTTSNSKPTKTSREKVIIGVLIGLLVIALAAVLLISVTRNDSETSKDKNIIERILDLFENILGMAEDNMNNINNNHIDMEGIKEDINNKLGPTKYNLPIKLYSGSATEFKVRKLLDEVITINKTNDRKITVKYEDVETQDETTIRNIKNNMEEGDFDIIYDYDKEGYIVKATIEKVEKKENPNNFNSMFSIFAGTKADIAVTGLLDKIVTSNKTNDRKVAVSYEGKETQNETEIINIKSNISGNYEIKFDYDEEGYIVKATITKTFTSNDVKTFNMLLEIYAGAGNGMKVQQLLSEVININKTKDAKITVKYGATESQKETEIKNISNKMDAFKNYNVSFGYNESGFINKVTIK